MVLIINTINYFPQAELSARDIEREIKFKQKFPGDTPWPKSINKFAGAKFAFSIYDFEGSDTVDAFYIGDVLRALNLSPTQKLCEKLGGTKKRNEKKFKVWTTFYN